MLLQHVFALAFVQGVTEFLPISSSAHLILLPYFMHWPDQGLALDVAAHVGTLCAVILYFFKDVRAMFLGAVFPRSSSYGTGLFWKLVLGTFPVVVAGFFLQDFADSLLRNLAVIAWATLLFGLLLYVADRFFQTQKTLTSLTYTHAFLIGLSQVFALIPGTSRSGITMTCARFLGYRRDEAAHFSMLLSIPTIVAAGVLVGYEIYQTGDAVLTAYAFGVAFLSFAVAFAAIWGMMHWLKKSTFLPFVVYRILLGIALLYFVYT